MKTDLLSCRAQICKTSMKGLASGDGAVEKHTYKRPGPGTDVGPVITMQRNASDSRSSIMTAWSNQFCPPEGCQAGNFTFDLSQNAARGDQLRGRVEIQTAAAEDFPAP